ncbi:hypothetical protein R6Q57_019140 [Mikania cordata]
MPKDIRYSSCRCRASPYSHGYKNADVRTPKSHSLPIGNETECEEARCPICMEHPHNAVLLLCSSHEKGCRPYMCDTSSRHSNCLDQFRKSTMSKRGKQAQLLCPLCRGLINGWTVVSPARQFMNSKTRSCSLGTCDFAGNYSQLREHARRVHPHVRPTDVDPERELEWRILEDDMEQHDMLNMQFEFDDGVDVDVTGFMDGMSDLASPILESDFDFGNLFSISETDFQNVLSEIDAAAEDTSLFFEDWDNMFAISSSFVSEIRESGRPRATHYRLWGRPRESAQITTHFTQSSNGQPSSHNHQEQVATLVDFHELSSNLP